MKKIPIYLILSAGLVFFLSIIFLLSLHRDKGTLSEVTNLNKQEDYLFDPTEERLIYKTNSYTYTINKESNFSLISNDGKLLKQFKYGPLSEHNILSVSPDGNLVALFEHMQSYGTSKLNFIDVNKEKIIYTANNSIGDIHWDKEGNPLFSVIQEKCSDDCKIKLYNIALHRLNLETTKDGEIISYTDYSGLSDIVEVIEEHSDYFIIGIRPLLTEEPTIFKKIDLSNYLLTNFDPNDLVVKNLGYDNAVDYRVEVIEDKDKKLVTYKIRNTNDRAFRKIIQK